MTPLSLVTSRDDKRICRHCIGEGFLRAKVRKQEERGVCDCCGKKANTFSIKEVAEDVRGAFERHYTRTAGGPSENEAFMYRESAVTWERESDRSTTATWDA